MLERSEYLPGVPCWIVHAGPDPRAIASFYAKLLGWEIDDRAEPGRYFVATVQGLEVAAAGAPPIVPEIEPAWLTYVAVESADAAFTRALRAGASEVQAPFDLPGQARVATLADPDGALFGIWEPKPRPGARLVNVPGTWNWSNLATPDAERAGSFYKSVFGWESTRLDIGQGPATMLRVPGYADFLERDNPGLRAAHAHVGAPEGFSDAIGWMSEESRDRRAGWSVTFAVEDVTAIAARANQQGGETIEPPTSLGPVETAVLRDPAATAFTINSFKPQ